MARFQFDPINPRAPFIWHGGDYNPEQWPPETWDVDMALRQQSDFNKGLSVHSAGFRYSLKKSALRSKGSTRFLHNQSASGSLTLAGYDVRILAPERAA